MNAPNLDQLLQEANAAADGRDYMQAIALYATILSHTNPQDSNPAAQEIRLTALRERGQLLNLIGEQAAALAGYEQYYLEAGNSRHAVEALVRIGNQHAYMAQYRQSIDTHQEALQLAEALNYTAGRAQAIGGLGLVYNYMDRTEEALQNLRKSLALFEQVGNIEEQIRAWNRIGVTHIDLGEVDQAIHAFKTCSDLALEIGLQDPTVWTAAVNALNNLGECYQQLFDMEQALVYHEKALSMVREREVAPLEADLCRNLGVDLRYLGRHEESLSYLRQALELSEQNNRTEITMQALYSLAVAEIEAGDAAAGYEHASRLRELAAQNNIKGSQADALYAMGLYHRRQEELTKAEQLWQQALFMAHETGRRMLLWQIHAALAEISTNPALHDVHNRIAAEVIQQIAFPIADETLRNRFLQAPATQAVLTAVGE